jgi:hypothetical protein
MSGPHDFAVRFKRPRQKRHQRPPHPAANVRDDRETPLKWEVVTLNQQSPSPTSGHAPADSGAGAPDSTSHASSLPPLVSREMRQAGEIAFDEFFGSYPPSLLVEEVYKAMWAVLK